MTSIVKAADMRPAGWDTVAHILQETKLFHQLFDWPSVIDVYSLLFGLECLNDPKTRSLFLPPSHVLFFDEDLELSNLTRSRYVAFIKPALLVDAKGRWVQPNAASVVEQTGALFNILDNLGQPLLSPLKYDPG